jgi:hypothetical protein
MTAELSPGGSDCRILLVEPEAGGHHFVPYAAALARALVSAGYAPELLTTREAIAHPAMSEFARGVDANIPIRLMPSIRPALTGSIPELLRAQFHYWHAVRRAIASLDAWGRPALCVLLGLDSCDRAIGLLGSPCGGLPFVGLSIHAKHHWPAVGVGDGGRLRPLNQWTFDRVLANRDCVGIATIDETLVAFESLRGRHGRRVRYVPDPGQVVCRHDRSDARAALGLDQTPPLVLVYGGLDGRKNIPPLLAAARRAKSSPLVALVGRITPEVLALSQGDDWRLLADEGRLRVEDGFASLDDEALWFGAADLVWVGYRSDFLGQSAVIPQAASAGVPVIGRRGGLIGGVVEVNGLGVTVDAGDVRAVAEALDALANARRSGEFGDNLTRFAAGRSHAAYGEAWCSALSSWLTPVDRQENGGREA